MSASLGQRALAELVGTALLVGLGTGSLVAGARLGGLPLPLLAVAWGVAVALPIQLWAGVSGAHLNPAVSGSLAVFGRFPPKELPVYWAAQIVGAFGGSLAVLATLGGGADLGATIPRSGAWSAVVPFELPFTLALVLAVLYLATRGRTPTRTELLLPAVVVAVSTELIGPWTGSSLNPARSLAPAVLSGVFTGWEWYLVAAIAAALLGPLIARLASRR